MKRVILLMLCTVGVVRCYSTGAPKTRCQSMEPNHDGNNADQDLEIKVEPHQSCYKANTQIMVLVTGPPKTKINGLLAIARAKGEGQDTSKGTWYTDQGNRLQTIDCFDNTDSGITHSEKINTYSQVGLIWQAPSGLTKDISFKVTVVNEKNKYWVGRQSASISYDANCEQDTYKTPDYKEEPDDDDDDDDAAAANLVVLPLLIACVLLAIFVKN